MRLMFVARAIDRTAGGVERMIITLMNELVARGHEISLFTWDRADAEPFYPMSPEVEWHRLNMGDPNSRASKSLILRRARAVRSLLARVRSQAIVCFQDGPFIAIRAYTLGLGVPVIAAERNALSRFDHIAAARYRPLILQSLRFAARIIIQCDSYRVAYPSYLHDRIVCIPNPIFPSAVQARPDLPKSDARYRLLSVGRLGFQKNYQVLIDAFARVADTFPHWDLVILGEGEDRGILESLIASRKLTNRVSLPGTTKAISEWYASSHLFCLPSRWEGFPNSLAEALAHGLPAIGFSGCAGVRDLILDGRSGLLAEGNNDPQSLASALRKAMASGDLRRSMGLAARDSVRKYDPSYLFSKWERLLSEVTGSEAPVLY